MLWSDSLNEDLSAMRPCWLYVQILRTMLGWLDGWVDGWLDEWMAGWLGGWMAGGLVGGVLGWLGGSTVGGLGDLMAVVVVWLDG